MTFSVHRTIAELQDYARRLHHVDPERREPIPVTPEEAFDFQDAWLASHRLTDKNCFKVDEMNIFGHRFKIL